MVSLVVCSKLMAVGRALLEVPYHTKALPLLKALDPWQSPFSHAY